VVISLDAQPAHIPPATTVVVVAANDTLARPRYQGFAETMAADVFVPLALPFRVAAV
jgi:hypothetical protein